MTSRAFCFAMIKGWSWKAILGGVAIEFIGPQFWNLILSLSIGLILVGPGLLRGESLEYLLGSAPRLPLLIMGGSSIVGEIILNAVGGYATAVWASKYKISHSILVGVLSLFAGLMMHWGSENWYRYNLLWVLPASLIGGWWSAKRHSKKHSKQPNDGTLKDSRPIAPPF